jgi:Cu(I)/Ag(I) efflux system periplasmic protein CusF
MTANSIRPFGLILIALALAACTSPGPAAADANATAPPFGVDLGSSDRNPAPESYTRVALSGEGHGRPRTAAATGEMQMAHAGHGHAQGTGTVNSVDASGHKINVTHGPIPALGWPGMTMDFAVAPAVDLRTLEPGTRVDFTIEQGEGGNYEIKSVKPAGGGR